MVLSDTKSSQTAARVYLPVAAMPQVTAKVAVELAGNCVSVMPVDCKASSVKGLGDTVIDASGVAEKVTLVQLRPVAAGSKNTLSGALAGP